MYFKLSNTAEKENLERMTKASFKYPNLYKPQYIIHGLKEVTIPIITMEDHKELSLAIWGLLPENHTDDWSLFQDSFNTLNFHETSMDSGLWYTKSLVDRRCLIPVTGYFTTFIENGEAYHFKIGLKNGNPFYLAGIYTVLEDGFITCSLLVGQSNDFIKQVQNVVDTMPITISDDIMEEWLSLKTTPLRTRQILKKHIEQDFRATSISDSYYNYGNTELFLNRP
ncbi:SOS response-associated peptidase family protein [Maribacter algicola]|nr:SOS response-associated peptidase family protein [Maribacter algicola]